MARDILAPPKCIAGVESIEKLEKKHKNLDRIQKQKRNKN
jgi:hypothetical protein